MEMKRVTQAEIQKRVKAARDYVRATDVLEDALGTQAFIVAETSLQVQELVRKELKKQTDKIAEEVHKAVKKEVTPKKLAKRATETVERAIEQQLSKTLEDWYY